MKDKIDVVIPWVDSHDSKWMERKVQYRFSAQQFGEYATSNRYRDYGTLKFVLRSIQENMPWVNNVYLVTDGQTPDWLNQDSLSLIDHTQFIKGNLPTFNSNVIMTNIAHIPGLSDKFIVFNDEMIVWKMVHQRDFFKNGLPVDSLVETGTVPESDGFFHISANDVALINKRFSKRHLIKKMPTRFFNWRYGFNNLRTILSLPYGGFIGFYNQHLILPYTKEDFKRAYALFPKAFNDTWKHRFRDPSDINEWLVRYTRNVTGNFMPGFVHGQYLDVSDFKNEIPKIKRSAQVIVINDGGKLDENIVNRIESLCLEKFPERSKYER